MTLTRSQTAACVPHINAYKEARRAEVGDAVYNKINRERLGLINVCVTVEQPGFIQYKQNWWSKRVRLGLRTHLHAMADLSLKAQVIEYVKNAFRQTVELSSRVDVVFFADEDDDLFATVSFCQ